MGIREVVTKSGSGLLPQVPCQVEIKVREAYFWDQAIRVPKTYFL
jgi:hypothetical protein